MDELEVPDRVVDPETFRSIMSAFPSGVTVVTTVDADNRPVGVTCSATCSVSQDPPLLLVCLHRASSVLTALLERGGFVVNFLRDNRENTSALFASRAGDRFASVPWEASPRSGLPWLPMDTIAHAECRVAHTVEAGDHLVVLGAIVHGAAHEARAPLMYWRRSYGSWPAEEDTMAVALTHATEG
jgi:flavin reductase (DIM6/NTAB) family NADH-FMN oxidoreductase RutF